ncbi:MAG TPA: SBBP repeat-containing protein [Vicinamibacterales bacterium]
MPLGFEPNGGQTDPRVDFVARGKGYALFLTASEAVLALGAADETGTGHDRLSGTPSGAVLRMQLVGAGDAESKAVAGRELPGKVNYFIGSDPAKWRTNIPTYAEVTYRNVYPRVDLAYYGTQGQLEYDFILAPGADLKVIALRFQGADDIEVDSQGNLVLRVRGGEIRLPKPLIYQEVDGTRQEISGAYLLKDAHQVGFQVAAYDSGRPLIIDPVMVYSTYLGGSVSDRGSGIAVDTLGSAYVIGSTSSSDFPTTSGAPDSTFNGNFDVFVTKLDPSGTAPLVYSTYLGGLGGDLGFGIAVDGVGNAYLTGATGSSGFPVTAGAFDTSISAVDVFVTKLSAAGSLLYSTFLGGSSFDEGGGIAVDTVGSAYVTGYTSSSNFPVTAGAYDTSPNGGMDVFVTKLDPIAGAPLAYSTYLGGTVDDRGRGIAVDGAGNAYATGETRSSAFPVTAGAYDTSYNGGLDGFVTKLDPIAGAPLVYSTYLGGTGDDFGRGIAVDGAGYAYATGQTGSSAFPVTAGAYDTSYNGGLDVFVTKLDPIANAPLVYSTYLGGGGDDMGHGIAVDGAGDAYATGATGSSSFPTTADADDTSFNGGVRDAFVTKMNATGSALLYSTYLGGSGFDQGTGIAVEGVDAYVTGFANTGFPTTAGAFDTSFNGGTDDAFVTKLSTPGTPAMLVLSPPTDTNPVGTSHTVMATVTDASGNPVQNIVVRFSVSGSVTSSGSCTTGPNGQCDFSYAGPAFPGTDLIDAYADTDGDSVQDASEPAGAATKAWTLPASTSGHVHGAGAISGPTGEKILFEFHAMNTDDGLKGDCHVIDRTEDKRIECVDVTTLVVVGNQATVYGNALDGDVPTMYVINVTDNGNPGKNDTFSITLGTGYMASGILVDGNIHVED